MDEMRLDEELRQALNVEPSAEFVARVRARIASEPAPSRWRLAPRNAAKAFWQTWVMVPATAVVILAAAAVLIRTGIEPVRPVAADVALAPVAPAPVSAPIVEPVRAVPARRTAARPRTRSVFDDVVVSEREQMAFNALLLALGQDRVPVRVQQANEVEETLVPPPMEVPDLIVEPLQVTRLD